MAQTYWNDVNEGDSIPDLVKKGHDICYLVVGEGDDRSRLEALAVQLGLTARVRFLGATEPQTLLEIYRAADLFVMPSTGEGFGVTFLGINLYTRFFELFWNNLHKAIFFALLAASFWYIGSKAETIWNFGKEERLSPRKA